MKVMGVYMKSIADDYMGNFVVTKTMKNLFIGKSTLSDFGFKYGVFSISSFKVEMFLTEKAESWHFG